MVFATIEPVPLNVPDCNSFLHIIGLTQIFFTSLYEI